VEVEVVVDVEVTDTLVIAGLVSATCSEGFEVVVQEINKKESPKTKDRSRFISKPHSPKTGSILESQNLLNNKERARIFTAL
jgi:hypothetical protein